MQESGECTELKITSKKKVLWFSSETEGLAQHLGCYSLPFHKSCCGQTREQAWEQQKEQRKRQNSKKKNGNYAWQSSEMC